jgi:ribose transport system substrate-binding protein
VSNAASSGDGSISRRNLLRAGALGIAGFATLDLAAACSSGSTNTTAGAGATSASGSAAASGSASAPLAPFVPSSAAGAATGLPKRLAWATTADSEFFLALGKGMQAAAKDRGYDYATATGTTPDSHVNQMNAFLARGVGALGFQPLDQTAEKPVLTSAIQKGVCTQGIITAPCNVQIAASQYQIGYDQGKAAADYATASLGGQAEVFYFNLDTLSPQLKLRHQGVLDGLKTGGPGIKVVSDLTVTDISIDKGFATMNTVIQAHPDVKIVMGGDTLVVGAYRAMKQSGKLANDMYFSGVDGDAAALELVKEGGAYRLSIAFAWGLMGYGMGQFGADWVEGKEVPRVLVAKGLLLDSPSAVTTFRADSADPGPVFKDPSRYQRYLPLLGNTSHAEHMAYWTDEYTPAS